MRCSQENNSDPLGQNETTESIEITEQTNVVTEILGRENSMSQTEINELDSLNIGFQFRGNCYAYSSGKNAIEHNGEWHSDNLPKKVDPYFPTKGLYLTINQNEPSKIDGKILGCKLYLVNTTDTLINLRASDSRLSILAEALNEHNEWTEISYLATSSCGNSYHTIILDVDEYWTFDIPVFKGPFKTKLRYTLTINKNIKIISNEIAVYLNKAQFSEENKEEYSKKNIMDPCEEVLIPLTPIP